MESPADGRCEGDWMQGRGPSPLREEATALRAEQPAAQRDELP